MIETLIAVLVGILFLFLAAWLAKWIIDNFIPEPMKMPALLITGVLLLICLLAGILFFLHGGKIAL